MCVRKENTMALLDWFRLEVVLGLAGAVGVITQVIKLAPPKFTTDYPKTVAWVVSAIVVGGIGYYEGADIATVVTVATAVALTAHGLYDVVSDLWNKVR